MKKAIYPGSFDPITNGHLDIIERSSKVFDEVIVGVLINPDKKGLFTIEERVQSIQNVIKPYENVKVVSFGGLLIDYMKKENIKIIIKGLRNVTDFEYEVQMGLMNNKLDSNVETVFMTANGKYSYLSSSLIKQVAMFGGSIDGLVPDEVAEDLMSKINNNK